MSKLALGGMDGSCQFQLLRCYHANFLRSMSHEMMVITEISCFAARRMDALLRFWHLIEDTSFHTVPNWDYPLHESCQYCQSWTGFMVGKQFQLTIEITWWSMSVFDSKADDARHKSGLTFSSLSSQFNLLAPFTTQL